MERTLNSLKKPIKQNMQDSKEKSVTCPNSLLTVTSGKSLVYSKEINWSFISKSTRKERVPGDDFHGDYAKYRKMHDFTESSGHKVDSGVVFDSEFECGNLSKVYRLSEREYVLLLSNDTGNDYAYWYYFKVISRITGYIRFHLVNITRREELVEQGMKPVVWSENNPNSGWGRGTSCVNFRETSEFSEFLDHEGSYYTLSFSYNFSCPDTVYFAYSFPYSYTMLRNYLKVVASENKSTVKVRKLARTLLGNICEYLIITEDILTFNKNASNHSKKKAIFLSSRVHSGETPSSFVIQGLIDYLLSNKKEALLLRKSFVFYIIPMLNPDGVKTGNSRCSALGVDLNRRWVHPSKYMHPSIFYGKQLIRDILERQEIVLICDIHGHSKKKYVFMYGCKGKNEGNSVTVVPHLLAQKLPYFSMANTHYKLEKGKEYTARIALYREFKIRNSYTMECSMFGPGSPYGHFTVDDYRTIGRQLASSFAGLTRVNVAINSVFQRNTTGKIFHKQTVNSPLTEKIDYGRSKSIDNFFHRNISSPIVQLDLVKSNRADQIILRKPTSKYFKLRNKGYQDFTRRYLESVVKVSKFPGTLNKLNEFSDGKGTLGRRIEQTIKNTREEEIKEMNEKFPFLYTHRHYTSS